jgi:hypothetical protein
MILMPVATRRIPIRLMEAYDVFMESLRDPPFMSPDGSPRPQWQVFTDKGWYGARLKAHDSLFDAAEGRQIDGRVVFNSRFSDAEDDAMDAARDYRSEEVHIKRLYAIDAAMKAATRAGADEISIYFAGVDAGLKALVALVSDLPGMEHHARHADQRMDVWMKGYGLIGDVRIPRSRKSMVVYAGGIVEGAEIIELRRNSP